MLQVYCQSSLFLIKKACLCFVLAGRGHLRTFQLPIAHHDFDNGNDIAGVYPTNIKIT